MKPLSGISATQGKHDFS